MAGAASSKKGPKDPSSGQDKKNPSTAAARDPFIVITPSSANHKLDPESRRYIRSHVMRGKNRKRPAVPAATDAEADGVQWTNDSDHSATDIQAAVSLPSPARRVANGSMSLLHLAGDVTPRMQQLVYQCLCHSPFTPILIF